jgi:succinate-acetate transporter protein
MESVKAVEPKTLLRTAPLSVIFRILVLITDINRRTKIQLLSQNQKSSKTSLFFLFLRLIFTTFAPNTQRNPSPEKSGGGFLGLIFCLLVGYEPLHSILTKNHSQQYLATEKEKTINLLIN